MTTITNTKVYKHYWWLIVCLIASAFLAHLLLYTEWSWSTIWIPLIWIPLCLRQHLNQQKDRIISIVIKPESFTICELPSSECRISIASMTLIESYPRYIDIYYQQNEHQLDRTIRSSELDKQAWQELQQATSNLAAKI